MLIKAEKPKNEKKQKVKDIILLAIVPPLMFFFTELLNVNGITVFVNIPAIVLNLVFYYLVEYLFFAFTKKSCPAIISTTILFGLLAIANGYVTEFRGYGFAITDIHSVETAVNMLHEYTYELNEVQLFAMIPIVVFTPLARKMVSKYGKKELATFGSIVSIVSGLGLFIIMPNNTGLDLIIYIVCQLFFSLGLGIYSTVSWAMMGDAIDYNEWKFGTREEGTVYSLHSFFRKLAQGIGPSMALVIMVALGYSEINAGNQLFSVALNMRYLVAALYLFAALMQVIGLGVVYNLNKKTLAQMNEELAARHAAVEVAADEQASV